MKHLKHIIFSCFVLLVSTAFGQTIVSGKVYDNETKKPLSYVNVFLENTYVGVTTNEEGAFEIEIPFQFRNDPLTFSYVGYVSQAIKTENINDNTTIYLHPENIQLDEVMLDAKTPDGEEIMLEFFKNVQANHVNKMAPKQGYMNYTFFDKGHCIAIGESTFVLDDNKVQQLKSRSISDTKRFKGIQKLLGKRKFRKVASSPEPLIGDIVKLDVQNHVKPSKKKRKEQSELNDHLQFTFDGYKKLNGRQNYVILFKVFKSKKPVFKGRLLIDTETYGCAAYNLFVPKEVNPNRFFFSSFFVRSFVNLSGFKVLDFTRELSAEFKYEDNKWELTSGRIVTGGDFKVKREKLEGMTIQEFTLYDTNKAIPTTTPVSITTYDFNTSFWGENSYEPFSKKHQDFVTDIQHENEKQHEKNSISHRGF